MTKKNTNAKLGKRFTIPLHRSEIYDYLDRLSKSGNMSEYLCDLVEKDMEPKPTIEDVLDAIADLKRSGIAVADTSDSTEESQEESGLTADDMLDFTS